MKDMKHVLIINKQKKPKYMKFWYKNLKCKKNAMKVLVVIYVVES